MAVPIKSSQLLYHSHVGTFLFKFISCHIMYLIARPEMAEDPLDACSSYCTHMASGHLSLQQQQHSGHFGSWEVALALVLVALTRPCLQAAHSSAAAAARGRRTHTGCIALKTALTPCIANVHASAARINASPLAMQCNAGCGGGGWCIAGGAAHPAPGWPCLLCHSRPRAAPTHLRAAAIRLNVAIWTNMDPSEGGRKCSHECSQDTCFRLILKVDNISSFH